MKKIIKLLLFLASSLTTQAQEPVSYGGIVANVIENDVTNFSATSNTVLSFQVLTPGPPYTTFHCVVNTASNVNAAMKISVEQSFDGSTWVQVVSFDAIPALGQYFTLPVVLLSHRIRYNISVVSGNSYNITINRIRTNAITNTPTQAANNARQYMSYRNNALSNTVQTVKPVTGNVYGVKLINTNATQTVYVKFFDSATVTLGTTLPIETIQVPPNTQIDIRPQGVPYQYFQTHSIRIVAVTGISDTDSTAPTTPCFVEVKYL